LLLKVFDKLDIKVYMMLQFSLRKKNVGNEAITLKNWCFNKDKLQKTYNKSPLTNKLKMLELSCDCTLKNSSKLGIDTSKRVSVKSVTATRMKK